VLADTVRRIIRINLSQNWVRKQGQYVDILTEEIATPSGSFATLAAIRRAATLKNQLAVDIVLLQDKR
jgi:hypothetical protein